MRCITPQATSRSTFMASAARHPGVRDRFEHHNQPSTEQVRPTSQRSSRTLPAPSWRDESSRSASLVSERRAIAPWESEPLIVAMKSGNADGAKGWQLSLTSQGNMCQTQSWSHA
jgi:hypothetical protein